MLGGRRDAEPETGVQRGPRCGVGAAHRQRYRTPPAGDLGGRRIFGAQRHIGPGVQECALSGEEGGVGLVEADLQRGGQRHRRDVDEVLERGDRRIRGQRGFPAAVDQFAAVTGESVDVGAAEDHRNLLTGHDGAVRRTARVLGDLGGDRVVVVPGSGWFELVPFQQFGVVEQDVYVTVVGQAVSLAVQQRIGVVNGLQVAVHPDRGLVRVDPVREIHQSARIDEVAETEVEVVEHVEFACPALHIEDLLAGQLVIRCRRDLERAAGRLLPRRCQHIAEGRHVRLVDQQLDCHAVEFAGHRRIRSQCVTAAG